jgi:hypothetical protein
MAENTLFADTLLEYIHANVQLSAEHPRYRYLQCVESSPIHVEVFIKPKNWPNTSIKQHCDGGEATGTGSYDSGFTGHWEQRNEKLENM